MKLLDRDTLLTAAREATGLDNFGDNGFIEALDRLLACLHEEACLNASGRLMLHHQYLQLLSNRLRLEHDLSRHPEIAGRPKRDEACVPGAAAPSIQTDVWPGLG